MISLNNIVNVFIFSTKITMTKRQIFMGKFCIDSELYFIIKNNNFSNFLIWAMHMCYFYLCHLGKLERCLTW